MKKAFRVLLVLIITAAPCLVMAAGSSKDNDIENMGLRLAIAEQFQYAKCWQTCADDDYGKLNCVTTCDDGSDSGSGGGSSGGSNLFNSPEGIILGSVLLVGIIVFVWYMADQSNAANGV
jgi:hypothetical protein